MRYRTHRNETLSEIGLGCYALSGAYGAKDPETIVDVVRRAYELGVTVFDTADQYGPAEEVLGRALAPFREEVWIATKVGVAEGGGFDLSAEHVQRSCETSLRRLQTDCIDLYQVHYDDPKTPVDVVLATLEKLRTEGKIRHYGVGHLSPPKLEAYFNAGDVFSALTEVSAAARSALQRTLPLCRAHDVGVIAFSITGRGLLSGTIDAEHEFEDGDIRRLDPLFQRERLASGLRVAARFQTLGDRYGQTPVQVAIAWVLAQPGVICALTGPSTIPHLAENLGGSGWSIGADDLAELDRLFRKEDEYLRQTQVQNVRTVLQAELDAQRGFSDLVYVLETLYELGFITEDEVLPIFQRLWSLREEQGAGALATLRGLQAELRDTFAPSLGEEQVSQRHAFETGPTEPSSAGRCNIHRANDLPDR